MDDQAQTIADIEDYKLLMIATLALVPLLAVSKKSTAQSDDHARPDNDGKLEIAERGRAEGDENPDGHLLETLSRSCLNRRRRALQSGPLYWIEHQMALSNTAQPQVPAKAAAQCHADPLWQEGCARLKWMVSARMRASILMVVGLAVGGCAQLGRLAAVSAEETGRATVLGIPDARFLPSDGAAIGVLAQRLYEREVRYFAAVGRPVPPEYILAVSGGGDNGAFGAGLLVGWSESGMRPRFKVVTGISTGALIAPFALLGSDFDPILREIYTTIEQKDIFERRPLLAGLASDALADSAPLEKLISKYLDERIVARLGSEYRQGRALIVITTNLDAGVPVIWNIGAIAESGHPEAAQLIRKILLASASIPALFPPVMFNVKVNGVQHQELHVDGGASMQTFLYPASLRIAKIGTAGVPRRRIAYIIRNGRFSEEWNEVERSTLSIANRAVATLTTNSGVDDLYRMYALAKRDAVGFRLAFIDNDFTEPHPTEFDRSYMTKLFEYGRAKARAGYPWLHAPPSF